MFETADNCTPMIETAGYCACLPSGCFRGQFLHCIPRSCLTLTIPPGLALPLVLFHACFVGTPPDSFTTAALVSVYAASYLALTLLNHQLTGIWTYPIVDEIEKDSGWAGVLAFFSVVVGLMVGLAFAGSALATAFST